MALTKAEAVERVSRGAALLDEMRPGWASRIDVGLLDIDSCTECLIGQLFRPLMFHMGCEKLGIHEMSGNALVTAHGFGRGDEDGRGDGVRWAGWEVLKDAWIAAIADRVVPKVEEVRHVGQGRKSLPALSEQFSPVLAHPAVREGR